MTVCQFLRYQLAMALRPNETVSEWIRREPEQAARLLTSLLTQV